MKSFLILTISLFALFDGRAFQGTYTPRVWVYFDRPFYVAGEDVRFKIFIGDLSSRSSENAVGPVQCNLYSPESETPIRAIKLEPVKGKVDGAISIPKNAEDGNYTFALFAGDKVISYPVKIFKDELSGNSPINPHSETIAPPVVEGTLEMELEGKRSEYRPREEVSFTLTTKNPDEELSFLAVSIFEKNNYLPRNISSFSGSDRPSTFTPTNTIQGTVYAVDKSSVMAGKIITGYLVKSGQIVAAFSDDNGRISLDHDRINGADKIYLNVFETSKVRIGEGILELDEAIPPKKPGDTFGPVERTPEIEGYIMKKLQRDRILKQYKTSLPEEKKGPGLFTHGPFVMSRTFDEYFTMASVRDAIREFIPNTVVRYNNKTEKEEIYLLEWGESKRFKQTPTFFINHIPTLSSDLILGLDYRSIERIDVHTAPQTISDFWQFGMYGVMSVILKEGHENPLKNVPESLPEITGLQMPAFLEDPYKIAPHDVPDLRASLYWDPVLGTGRDGKADFGFYCSDDVTDYVIEVFGVSESGKTGYLVETMSVVRPSGE